MQEKEDPEGKEVAHKPKEEEQGVQDCQSQTEGRVFKCARKSLVGGDHWGGGDGGRGGGGGGEEG